MLKKIRNKTKAAAKARRERLRHAAEKAAHKVHDVWHSLTRLSR